MVAAITFPLPLTAFADKLPIQSVRRAIQYNDQIDGLENGQLLVANVAPPLRRWTVNLRPLEYYEDDEISAIIEAMDGSLNPFFMYMPPRLYPAADPDGSILGANVVTITAIDADNKRLTLSGLPANYVLTRSDCMHFQFGGAANLRAFHRIVSPTEAASAGGVLQVEVRPHLHPGTALGTVVTLKKPCMKAVMYPGSYDDGELRGTKVTGKKFEIIERY